MDHHEHLHNNAWMNSNYGVQTGMYNGGQESYFPYPVMSPEEAYMQSLYQQRSAMQEQTNSANEYPTYPIYAPPPFSSGSSVTSSNPPASPPKEPAAKKSKSKDEGPTKRSLDDYAWLVVITEPCYSDRQIASGMDLTHVKKKYKRMFCLICAEYNSSSSWAHMKPRKFEKDGLEEHEASIHHKRALAAQSSSSGSSRRSTNPPPLQIPSLTTNQNIVVPSIQTTFPGPLIPPNLPTNDNFFTQPLLPTMETLTSGATILASLAPSTYPQPLNGSVPSLPFGHPSNALLSEALASSSSTAPLCARRVYAPDWLHLGATITSAAQQERPGLHKKYRLLMCKCCAQFNQGSPWATLRPRKHETAVLLEHEKSMFHKKALDNARNHAIQQEQEQQHHHQHHQQQHHHHQQQQQAMLLNHSNSLLLPNNIFGDDRYAR